ncbi:unnamed protein product [Periconia digitata]|uniref:Zn(2)-C6 fungal-type domain-containing protein n=1 Tax=Periconia digitata TaxID=1303443 RepID=A0A9W4UFN2_9PLEO|nr:unnamed protein product [Periconia digitata]
MSQETNDPQAAANNGTAGASRASAARDYASSFPEDTSRRKSSTKRCVTCKARRVKCDETKPACNQCARRRMSCGGYRKDIRFRPVEKPLAAARTKPDRPRNVTISLGKAAHSTSHARNDHVHDLEFSNPGNDDLVLSSVEDSSTLATTDAWPGAAEFDLSMPDIGLELPWHILPHPHFDVSGVNDGSIAFDQGVGFDDNGMGPTPLNLDLSNFLLTCSPSPTLEYDASGLPFGPHSQEETDSIERVASLFHQQTCQLLSIYEEPSKNPWSTLIWPMVKDSKALFHAVAAMTCLQLSHSEPAMRDRGLVHIQKSTQALELELNSGSMQMEAALAATIALGFAETWDHKKSSKGRDHIKGARILLQQSLSNHMSSPHNGISTEQSARLHFLANTWIYMDVIARLTSDCGTPLNSEVLSLFGQYEPHPGTNELDSLMGYASTLFPLIGRVGDLVTQIRNRCSTRNNSPAIISRAIDLRREIENWTLAISLEHIDNPTSNMSDAIQTAEAYRWCTLLYLQQAVPELPNLSSVGELGRKTLVYIATVPSSSHTAIVHTYPLMVAGSEAVEEDDREFVRERWQSLSKRMRTGIVDRCLEITEEVWHRRDAFIGDPHSQLLTNSNNTNINSNGNNGNIGNGNGNAHRHASSPTPTTNARNSPDHPHHHHHHHHRIDSALNDHLPTSLCDIDPTQPRTEKETTPWANGSASIAPRRSSSITAPTTTAAAGRCEFPISAAFKKGVDCMTRSGSLEYTVRGRLHFLGVMEDWGWEGKFLLLFFLFSTISPFLFVHVDVELFEF